MAEYTTDKQQNYGWGLTFDMSAKAPAISKRIWTSYADALEYINNVNDTAIAGLQLSVIGDSDPKKNGIYFVEKIGTGSNDGILRKVGDDVKVSLQADNYSAALLLATSDNIGQIIYVNNEEAVEGGEPYTAGPYIVTGAGTIAKLGTTTATGDIAGDVETLKGSVGDIETNVTNITNDITNINNTLADKADASNVYTKTEADEAISVAISGKADASSVYTKDDVYTKTETDGKIEAAINALPDQAEYTLTKAVSADEGFAGTYQLYKDGVAVGDKINIPLDQVLQSATIEEVTINDNPYAGAVVGDKYIKFIFQNNNTPQYLSVQDLVDVYTAGDYIEISSDNKISVKYDDLKSVLDSVYDVKGAAVDAVAGLGAVDVTEGNYVSGVSVVDGKLVVAEKALPVIDTELSADSVNAVQNKAVYAKFGVLTSLIDVKFKLEIVNELPTSEISTTTIYLVPQGSDNYLEYIYVDSAWKKLGSNDYYSKSEIDAKFNEVNNTLANKADASSVYNKDEVDARFNRIESISNEEIESIINSNA